MYVPPPKHDGCSSNLLIVDSICFVEYMILYFYNLYLINNKNKIVYWLKYFNKNQIKYSKNQIFLYINN